MKEIERTIIKEMPDKETLEEFVNGMYGMPRVIFNANEGRFEWKNENERPVNTDTS